LLPLPPQDEDGKVVGRAHLLPLPPRKNKRHYNNKTFERHTSYFSNGNESEVEVVGE